jgi:hypothetical protein
MPVQFSLSRVAPTFLVVYLISFIPKPVSNAHFIWDTDQQLCVWGRTFLFVFKLILFREKFVALIIICGLWQLLNTAASQHTLFLQFVLSLSKLLQFHELGLCVYK